MAGTITVITMTSRVASAAQFVRCLNMSDNFRCTGWNNMAKVVAHRMGSKKGDSSARNASVAVINKAKKNEPWINVDSRCPAIKLSGM